VCLIWVKTDLLVDRLNLQSQWPSEISIFALLFIFYNILRNNETGMLSGELPVWQHKYNLRGSLCPFYPFINTTSIKQYYYIIATTFTF
jgi:hypothetical protein